MLDSSCLLYIASRKFVASIIVLAELLPGYDLEAEVLVRSTDLRARERQTKQLSALNVASLACVAATANVRV